MRFTEEEFRVMVQELLYEENVKFDMLCQIAEQTLRGTVEMWCATEDCLKGGKYANDLMQEIHLRLMMKTVPYFLLRGDTQDVNLDAHGFHSWMFEVARNMKSDFVKAIRKDVYRRGNTDPNGIGDIPDYDAQERLDRIERLNQALMVVLDAGVGIYKVLTWLAQFVVILDHDVSKIQSNGILVDTFEDKTLSQMYDMILAKAESVPWLTIPEARSAQIRAELAKEWRDGIPYGDATYRSFFMKSGGSVSGKKSISDWVNRMNKLIKRELDQDTPASAQRMPDAEKSSASPDSVNNKKEVTE